MGRYSKGILGSISGKVGTVVGSSWNGIDYFRSLPKRSSKAPTDLQLEQRARLALVVNFLKPVKSVINVGFKTQNGNSGFNQITSALVKDAITGIYPDYALDYSKVAFSRGDLVGPWNVAISSVAPGIIHAAWTDNSGSNLADATDKAVLIVYNEAQESFVFTMAGANRSVGQFDQPVPESYSGQEVHVWMAFIAADGKTMSTSIYAGTVDVA